MSDNISRIHVYPEPFLRKRSVEIEHFDSSLADLIEEMFRIMKETSGIGLAAPQIGISKRILVIDDVSLKIGPEKKIIINPEILGFSDETGTVEEGCLSVPEIYAPVKRHPGIRYKYYDEEGNCYEGDENSFWARVFQHELDHLNGILFIDRLSSLQKRLIKKRLQQLRKIYQE